MHGLQNFFQHIFLTSQLLKIFSSPLFETMWKLKFIFFTSFPEKTSHANITKYLTFWMSKAHNSIVWIVSHQIQSSHSGIELRHHLTYGDIQPAEEPFFTLSTQYITLIAVKREKAIWRYLWKTYIKNLL